MGELVLSTHHSLRHLTLQQELDQDANILGVDFSKSAIRSREAFSYEQAQIRIDDR